MQLLLVASLASVTLAVSAPEGPGSTDAGLEWSQHYAQAKQQAAEENRPLLVIVEDASNPEGQFPEKLASDPAQVELLKQFRLCRMDVNTPYGKRVAEAYGANKFPMTVITDKQAKFVTFRADGNIAQDTWQQTLASRLKPADAIQHEVYRPITSPAQPSNIVTPWQVMPTQAPSNCPNCVRSQQYYFQ